MTKRMRALGFFDRPITIEEALQKLDDSHFYPERIFIVAKDVNKETEIVGSELCESLRHRFDEEISSIVKQDIGIKADGSVISLTKALVQLDIPVDIARSLNNMVARGKYLVVLEGDRNEIAGAGKILNEYGVKDWVVCKILVERPEIITIDLRDAA